MSLRERLDAEAGERTEPDGAFADTAVAAGPPSPTTSWHSKDTR